MQFSIQAAQMHHQSILENLLELYSHDCSHFFDLQLGPEGLYGYDQLPLYWQEPDRFPFLIYRENQLAGFAFVRRGSRLSHDEADWDMAEFFIVRNCRRQGAGAVVAKLLWKMFPGRWEIRVLGRNQPALSFWTRTIAEFMGTSVTPSALELDGKRWYVFRFLSEAA